MKSRVFEFLWQQAEAEREQGHRERSIELYRQAFASLGVDPESLQGYLDRRETAVHECGTACSSAFKPERN